MKVLDVGYKKEFVYDLYSRIIDDYKAYDKVTKKKMFEVITEFYSDYNNIIDLCTVREIKFLKKVAKGEDFDYRDDKYNYELFALFDKMLIVSDFEKLYLPDEFKENILEALSKVNMKEAKEKDALNEFLIGYIKVNGNCLAEPLINLASQIFEYNGNEVDKHVFYNKLFNYYVGFTFKYIESLEKNFIEFYYKDYSPYLDDIDEARMHYNDTTTPHFDMDMYKAYFYNDIDTTNKTIVKFIKKLKELPVSYESVLYHIRICALLDNDREYLKNAIIDIPSLKGVDLSDFFKLMDQAMDEIPSGALNGMTPKEYREKLKEKEEYEEKKYRGYVKQRNACLGDDIAKGFYNLYFSLLEYVNNKYHIDTSLKKIYKQEQLDPNQLMPIIEYLFEDKEKIIDAYLKDNPHNFDSEDLEKVSKFKQGIRGMFTIAKYEEDYTAVLSSDRVYMIKGLNSNIDEVIPYHDIPCIVTTSLFPYDGVIVYDGLLSTYPISMGTSFAKMVEKEYNEDMKYYHL